MEVVKEEDQEADTVREDLMVDDKVMATVDMKV